MQQTYQDRLTLNAVQTRWLDAFGALYGKLQRKLYSYAAKGVKLMEIKSEFCVEHKITARQFNSLRIELEGKISGTIELLKTRRQDLMRSIKKTQKTITSLERSIKGQYKLRDNETKSIKGTSKPRVFDLSHLNKLIKRKFDKSLRLVNQQSKLLKVNKRLNANVPGICFGSRKLFKQQFHLELTDFMAHGQSEPIARKQWKTEWQDVRSHQIFLVGSKDELCGNASCKAVVVRIGESETLTLKIRMPDALIAQGAPKLLSIDGVRFEYGQAQVLDALNRDVALTYRFHRDTHATNGWRVFVSTNTMDAAKTSAPASFGVLGVDFNADHLAWSHTDRFGNASNKSGSFGRIDLNFKHKTTEQRDAIISGALDDVFSKALKFNCPVAIEALDFAAKKRELGQLGIKHSRMLSGLAYAKYQSLAKSKAARLGIELIFVDPAYTSVAGSVKYAVRLGRTVHQAAAGVIARRAQGFTESLPRANAKEIIFRAPLMGCMAVITLPVESGDRAHVTWAVIRKSLTGHCAQQVRIRKDASRQNKSVSKHLLDGSKDLSREPGDSLARRNLADSTLTDVPF